MIRGRKTNRLRENFVSFVDKPDFDHEETLRNTNSFSRLFA